MSGQLRFELLGPVRAWLDGTEVDLGAPQQRALLGVLLLHEGAVATSDALVSAVWGETAPPAVGGMVRSYVSKLRRVLGDGRPATVIRSGAGGYSMPTQPGMLDLTDVRHHLAAAREARRTGELEVEAEQLRAALARWQGTPLSGVRGEYADRERTRLRQLWLSAVEDLAAADLELGRPAEAEAALAPLVIEHPLRERPRALLMLALYRSGRQAEALELYQQAVHLFTEELGLDPGEELRELQRRILRSDPGLAGPTPVRPLTSAERARKPMQLPPDLAEFTGHTGLVREIGGGLSGAVGVVPVHGLVGLPGIGKTTTAVHIGHQVAGDFPDGQFYVYLRQLADDPFPVLLRGIGAPEVPEDRAERAALWRTLTCGRKVLLVLDDAESAERVRELLPGPGGAAVLLTARQRLFGLTHATWHKVAGLSTQECLDLLRRTVGEARVAAEPDCARTLVELADGLPQVVHAVAARLAARPEWTLATAVRRLHAPATRLVEEPYADAVRALSPEQARALRLAAVPDGPDLSLAAAAAVLDRSAEQAEELLEALADRHLVEPLAQDRYRYLRPVREFARARALTEDGQAACHAALVRLAHHYAAGLRATEGTPEATAWRAAEQENLWACAVQTADLPGTPAHGLGRLLRAAEELAPLR
ncbi:DNA-binding SARP family transcriptional activator [Crossiella equi]|uniref:DNA-binding SARP family transcriptional activator n=1 Tax=Crossiella equi TaxID=130796 RepID=A0ABS5ALV2_9PSEU|nr:BTAD domain-containing putative transcriptional regulator [Crossiella equi]MBP2477547.1 DNA-binding SARP family transcriptional activator [Crossiella equi]